MCIGERSGKEMKGRIVDEGGENRSIAAHFFFSLFVFCLIHKSLATPIQFFSKRSKK